MKLLSLIASLSIVLALSELNGADVAPRTERPTGEYRVVRLELSKGLRHDAQAGRRTTCPPGLRPPILW